MFVYSDRLLAFFFSPRRHCHTTPLHFPFLAHNILHSCLLSLSHILGFDSSMLLLSSLFPLFVFPPPLSQYVSMPLRPLSCIEKRGVLRKTKQRGDREKEMKKWFPVGYVHWRSKKEQKKKERAHKPNKATQGPCCLSCDFIGKKKNRVRMISNAWIIMDGPFILLSVYPFGVYFIVCGSLLRPPARNALSSLSLSVSVCLCVLHFSFLCPLHCLPDCRTRQHWVSWCFPFISFAYSYD